MSAWRGVDAAAVAVVAGVALMSIATPVRADPLSVVNAVRTRGCGRGAPSAPALKTHKSLDTAARELARTGKLRGAVEGSGYPAARSASLHVKGPTTDEDLRRALAGRSCSNVVDAQFTELGSFRKDNETWMVFAAPLPKPPVLQPAAQATRVLRLVNEARAAARSCGGKQFAPAPPLSMSPVLASAAAAHARDMAEHGELTHTGSDGSQPAERITRAGYPWRASGENVAAVQQDADAVVAG